MKKFKLILALVLFLIFPTLFLFSCGDNDGNKQKTISFICEDELVVGEMPETLKCESGDEIILPNCSAQKSNYHFSGWSYESIIYLAGETFIVPDYDVVFKPIFKIDQLTLQVINGSGSGTYDYGTSVEIIANTVEKKEFSAWNINGQKIYENPYNIVLTEALIVEAEYDDLFDLKVYNGYIKNVNGETFEDNEKTECVLKNNYTFTIVANKPDEDHEFVGWAESENGQIINSSKEYVHSKQVSKDLIFYAVFKEKDVLVEINNDLTYQKNYYQSETLNTKNLCLNVSYNNNVTSVQVTKNMVSGFSTDICVEEREALIYYKDFKNKEHYIPYKFKVIEKVELKVYGGYIVKSEYADFQMYPYEKGENENKDITQKDFIKGSCVTINLDDNSYDSNSQYFVGWKVYENNAVEKPSNIYSSNRILELEVNSNLCIEAVFNDLYVNSISVDISQFQKEYWQNYHDKININNLNLILNYNNGSNSSIPLTDNMITSIFDFSTAGEKTVEVSYSGLTTLFNYNVIQTYEYSVENAYIESLKYANKEEVSANIKYEKTEEGLYKYNLPAGAELTLSERANKFKILDYTGKWFVSYEENSKEEINPNLFITKDSNASIVPEMQPKTILSVNYYKFKNEFGINEIFNVNEGAVVEIKFNDESIATIAYNKNNFVIEDFNTSETSSNNIVKVYYCENEIEVFLFEYEYSVYKYFNVIINDGYIYKVNGVLQTNLVNNSLFKNGTQLEIKPIDKTESYMSFYAWSNDIKDELLIIDNLDSDIYLTALYKEFEISSISLVDSDFGTDDDNNQIDYKTNYALNETINLNNMYLFVEYENGETRKVSLLFNGTVNDFSTLILGENKCSITYKKLSVDFVYNVYTENEVFEVVIHNGKVLNINGVEIDKEISTHDFVIGTNLVLVPVVGENEYFDGWYDSSNNLLSEELNYELTNLSSNLEIYAKIEKDSITKIELTGTYKKEYDHNEDITYDGFLMNVFYASGKVQSNIQVDESMIDENNPYSTSEVGEKTGRLNYKDNYGNTASVDFEYVVYKVLTDFEVDVNRSEFYLNVTTEDILSSLTMKAKFSDKPENIVSLTNEDIAVNEISTSQVGNVFVNISYTYRNITKTFTFTISIVEPPKINNVYDLQYEEIDDVAKLTWKCDEEETSGFNIYINDNEEKVNSSLIEFVDGVIIYNYEFSIIENIKKIRVESVPADSFNFSPNNSYINLENSNEIIEKINNLLNNYNFDVIINDKTLGKSEEYKQNDNLVYYSNKNIEDLSIEYEKATIKEAKNNKKFIISYLNKDGVKTSNIVSYMIPRNLFDILNSKVLSKLFIITNSLAQDCLTYNSYIHTLENDREIFEFLIENATTKILAEFKFKSEDCVLINYREYEYSVDSWNEILSVSCDKDFVAPEINYSEYFEKFDITIDENIVENINGAYSGEGVYSFIKGESVEITPKLILDNKLFSNWIVENNYDGIVYDNILNLTISENVLVSAIYIDFVTITNNSPYISLNGDIIQSGDKTYAYSNLIISLNLPDNLAVDNDTQLVFKFSNNEEFTLELRGSTIIEINLIENILELAEVNGGDINLDVNGLVNCFKVQFLIGDDGAVEGYAPDFVNGYYPVGSEITLPKNYYYKLRHNFIGWSDGSNIYNENSKYGVSTDVIFTPVFEAKEYVNEVKVTFIDNFNNTEYYVIIEAGELIEPSYKLTATDKYLSYWYKQGTQEPFDFMTQIEEDIVFETCWVDQNNVKFIIDYENNYAVVTSGENIVGQNLTVNNKNYVVGYIPEYYLGYKVLKISSNAFSNYASNVQILINNSVEIIDNQAFGKTNNLLNTTLIGFVGSIDNGVIEYNTSIKYIGDYAFANLFYFEYFSVSSLKQLNYIGNYAFRNTFLKEVTICENVHYIGKYAFESANIYNLSFVNSGDVELIIDDYAFYDSMRNWGNVGSHVISEGIFVKQNSLGVSEVKNDLSSYNVVLPKRLVSLGLNSFMQFAYNGYSSGIKSITINSSISVIADGALSIEGLENLLIYDYETSAEVTISDNQKYQLENGVLYELKDGVKFKIILAVAQYQHETENNVFAVANDISEIGSYAMLGLNSDNINQIVIPASVSKIGKGAFVVANDNINIVFEGSFPEIYNSDNKILKNKNFGIINENNNVFIVLNYNNLEHDLNYIQNNQCISENVILSKIIVSAIKTEDNDLSQFTLNAVEYNLYAYENIDELLLDINNENSVTDYIVNNKYFCKIVNRVEE